MIYILAANLEDARGWAFANGIDRRDMVFCGNTWNLPRAFVDERDRIVRTPRAADHPGHVEIERMVAHMLDTRGLTETVNGRLVRRSA